MKKKALFIDRDGTIIFEPMPSEQVDSLELLEFIPGAIVNLHKLAKETDFEFVMVTNQDGLGTDSFPEETFWPPQNKMLNILKGEGVEFDAIKIDEHFPEDNSPNRKPGTGLLTEYMQGDYDLENSYVLGDRYTDVLLAKNLGAKAVYIGKAEELDAELLPYCRICTESWDEIYEALRLPERKATVVRKTKETDIEVEINLDGNGKTEISTGLGFFDHMLEQISKHGQIDLKIITKGDLHVDEHHTVEDTALALGEAFVQALGNKRGVERYGFCLPMDDCLAQVALDFGGRNWLIWETEFKRENVGDVPTEMFFHFFKSFSDAAKANLNIKAEGDNDHHKIEGIFKAFAKAIKQAVKRDAANMQLPSTKGVL